MIEKINSPVTEPAKRNLHKDDCKIARERRYAAAHPFQSSSQN